MVVLKENFGYQIINQLLDYYGTFVSVTLVFLSIGLISMSIRRKHEIPGRLGLPFLGETISFLRATNSTKGCYDFVTVRRKQYGSWFKTRILGKIHVFIPSVEGAKKVYKNDFGLFNKGYVKSMGDLVGKKSVFIVPKGGHEKIRSLLSEPFSMNHVSDYVHKIDQMVTQRLKNIGRSGKSFRVLAFTMKLGFDAICNILMGITDDTLLDQMNRDCEAVYDAMLTFPVMIPGTLYYKGIKARERLMEQFKTIISERRSGKVCSDDFLQSILRKNSNPVGEKLDDEEIMDNLLTTMISGQNTTATAMMWSVKFLSDHPQIQDKVGIEQLTMLRRRPTGALLTYEDVNSMPYASKVIKETLRMCNIVLWFPRVASADCLVDGFEIKKGWHVNVDATYIHYDPALHKDPLQFNPSRFDEMTKPYTYMPFGSGPRTCLGINMAKVTMLVFLHRLTSAYKWRVDDPDLSLECKGFIPKLRSGLPITLEILNGGN